MRRAPAIAGIVALLVASGSLAAWAAGGGFARASRAPRVLEEVPATSNSLERTLAQNSPTIAVDPTDARFVALAHRVDSPDFECKLQISGDGGRGWIAADPVPELPPEAEKCYAPEIGFDAGGRLYYLFLGLAGTGNTPTGVYLTTSDTRGRTFTAPRKLMGPRNYQVRMVIDPDWGDRGRIHLVWLQSAGDPPTGGFALTDNPIVSAHSDDGGHTFSEPVRVSDPARRLVVGPGAAVADDGSLHVAYFDLQQDIRDYRGLAGPPWEGTWSLVTTRSTDGERKFDEGAVVTDEIVPIDRVILIFTMPPPSIDLDGEGNVFVSWDDARNGDADVFVARSADGGRAWSEPIRVNDDDVGSGATQYLPRMAVAPDGRVDVIFFDRRRDDRDTLNDVFYAYSTDGGRRFSPNIRVTEKAGTSRNGQRYLIPSSRNRNDIGSRSALVSLDDRALAAWTDTRNAALRSYQDIFATTLVFAPGDNNAVLWIALALLGAGLVGAAAVAWTVRPQATGTARP
jgi:hypothetical protein